MLHGSQDTVVLVLCILESGTNRLLYLCDRRKDMLLVSLLLCVYSQILGQPPYDASLPDALRHFHDTENTSIL